MLRNRPAVVECALQIGADDKIPLLFRHPHEQIVSRYAGIVHQNVDSLEFLRDIIHNGSALRQSPERRIGELTLSLPAPE